MSQSNLVVEVVVDEVDDVLDDDVLDDDVLEDEVVVVRHAARQCSRTGANGTDAVQRDVHVWN